MSFIKFLVLASALAIAVAAGFVFEGHVTSLAWHVLHGRNAAFQGHEFELPLLWRAKRVDGSSALFARAVVFGSETHNLLIEHSAKPEVLARPGQARHVRKPLQISAKSSGFTCFLDEAQGDFEVSELVCVSKGLDLTAYSRGDDEEMKEAKAILGSTN